MTPKTLNGKKSRDPVANELQRRSQLLQKSGRTKRGVIALYICNCNGIRERDVLQAIEKGATRPAHVFRHNGCRAECAKCVCDMRAMIDQQAEGLKYAAE